MAGEGEGLDLTEQCVPEDIPGAQGRAWWQVETGRGCGSSPQDKGPHVCPHPGARV